VRGQIQVPSPYYCLRICLDGVFHLFFCVIIDHERSRLYVYVNIGSRNTMVSMLQRQIDRTFYGQRKSNGVNYKTMIVLPWVWSSRD